MYKFNKELAETDARSPMMSLIGFVVLLIAGTFFGGQLAILLVLPFSNVGLDGLSELLRGAVNTDREIYIIYAIQGLTHLLSFTLIPLLYLRFFERKNWFAFNGAGTLKINNYLSLFALTLLISYLFLPLNGMVIEWNQELKLPEFMNGFEVWARSSEDRINDMIEKMTIFDSLPKVVLGILVIGLLPAIGEEIVFRGMLQNILTRFTKNVHIAILLTGFIFSAFHLQFYGLVPRMLLGILFGYLYFWSQSLSISIWAHFINNAGTVILMYLYQQKVVDFDVSEEPKTPLIILLLVFVFFSASLFIFKRISEKRMLEPER